jgi:hypothetical protein
MKGPGTKHWLRVIFVAAAWLLALGCSGFSDREGELVRHWITCLKSQSSGSWGATDKYNRFSVVHDSRYQVSFASQRVVSSIGPLEFSKCVVYDRKNWTCQDFDGSTLIVEGGSRGTNCSKATRACYLDVGLLQRAIILSRGVKAADHLCDTYSAAFETILMRRQ